MFDLYHHRPIANTRDRVFYIFDNSCAYVSPYKKSPRTCLTFRTSNTESATYTRALCSFEQKTVPPRVVVLQRLKTKKLPFEEAVATRKPCS
jgi:phage FluMu protein Com